MEGGWDAVGGRSGGHLIPDPKRDIVSGPLDVAEAPHCIPDGMQILL